MGRLNSDVCGIYVNSIIILFVCRGNVKDVCYVLLKRFVLWEEWFRENLERENEWRDEK